MKLHISPWKGLMAQSSSGYLTAWLLTCMGELMGQWNAKVAFWQPKQQLDTFQAFPPSLPQQ